MWNVPLPLQDNPSPTSINTITNRSIPPKTDMINYLGETKLQKDGINFLYAACFSLTKSTFPQTVEANFLTTWTNLTPYNVKNYLLKSMPSTKGHLDQQYMHTRSTSRKTNLPTTLADKDQILPIKQIEESTNFVFFKIWQTTRATREHKIATDQTGQFPVKSNRGNE